MSLMTTSRASLESWTVWVYSRCSASREVSSSSSVIPMTAFMGVRISWLIAARNADLAVVAERAWSRAAAIVRTALFTARAICAISRGPDTCAGSV
jgi:hypothetical protein